MLPVGVAIDLPTVTAGPVRTAAGGWPVVLKVRSAPLADPAELEAASR
jgi:hypothetical protein